MMERNTKITEKELHANYVRLARIVHPDVNQEDPTADEKFQILQEQYEKAQKIVKSKNQFQASVTISLKESIEGTERYFVSDDGSRFVLNIPAGIKHRQTIQYNGLSSESIKNASLHIKVFIQVPPKYSIVGNHLILKESISYWKLFFGGSYQILVPDGRKIPITIPKKTKNGKMFMIRGAGLMNRIEKTREPLYIQFFGSLI